MTSFHDTLLKMYWWCTLVLAVFSMWGERTGKERNHFYGAESEYAKISEMLRGFNPDEASADILKRSHRLATNS